MGVPTDQPAATGASRFPVPLGLRRSPARRRPSGEPPPLPYHLRFSGIGWLVAAVLVVGLSLAFFSRGLRGPAVAVTVADDAVVGWLRGLDAPGLVGFERALAALGSWWVINLLLYGLILALLVLRRWRHLIVFVIVANLVILVVELVGVMARRARPFGVEIQAAWGGWALPPHQVTFLAALLVSVLYTLVPVGRWRNTGKSAVAVLVALLAVGRVTLGADAPTDVLVGVVLGVTLPLLAFRRFAPSDAFPVTYRRGRTAHVDVGGRRGEAIRRAVRDQLGVVVLEVEPFGQQYSASSTPLRLRCEPDTYLFAKLYTIAHLRADRWYKLGRELLYGRLEDEKSFGSVRRLVEREDYALRLCRDAGLPVPRPFGSVELTPEREYLLVAEFLEGARELGEVEADEAIIDDGLGIVRKLWTGGLAHRDVKPANLLVQDGRVRLIDTLLVEVHPSPWRQAVDLANMMLCLALRSDAERVYLRARQQFTDAEIAEAFAATQGSTMPSQVRQLLQRTNLRAEFAKLLPVRPQPVRIQRWSLRRVGLMALAAALAALVVGMTLGSLLNNDVAEKTSLGIARLDCDRYETLWLMAQSVPSASQLPCIREELTGWSVSNVTVNDGRSVITLNHDRAGPGAVVVQLTATCDSGDAVEAPSQRPEVRRYERMDQLRGGGYSATRYDRFPGGCVTYQLSSFTDVDGKFATETAVLLGFTTREALAQALEQRSGGRLHLDRHR
jgi:tRNA A-37 threonylcarbamoyl transferase component Bud32